MSFIAYLRKVWFASHSREHEKEADELGIKLAAMSCFNTRRAAKVFAKMHDHNVNLDREEQVTIAQLGDSSSSSSNNSGGSSEVVSDGNNHVVENERKRKEGYELSSFMDSHPPTLLRYDYLLNLSKEENPDKYSSQCNNTRRKLWKALKLID